MSFPQASPADMDSHVGFTAPRLVPKAYMKNLSQATTTSWGNLRGIGPGVYPLALL
jgi:hypothetical protein